MGDNVLASAAASASYNMLLQLMLRVFTFLLNAVILRYISKDILGIVNVRLLLLVSTIVFVAREAFRRACLSSDLNKPWRQIMNLLWTIIPIGGVCAVIFGVLWAYCFEQPDPAIIPYYRLSVLCFSVCGFAELLSEPLAICGQMLLFVKLKVLTEGLANFAGCIVNIVLIIMFPHWGLLAFCYTQVVVSFSYTIMHYIYFIHYIHTHSHKDDAFPFKHVTDLLPQRVPNQPIISWSLASLTWSFFKQSILKQLLTEGERYIMTVFDVLNFGDQGVYDVVKNLGSLVARFLFLPLEESGYLFFSQTIERGKPAKMQAEESIHLASDVLHYLLKTVILIGVIIVIFGFPYSQLALDIYGGKILSEGSGPSLLRYYCLYVLVLAVNGITECFTFATMSKKDIDRYNSKMLVFSAVFLFASWYLTGPLGSAGFILANCLNMIARIIHSIYYILAFYKDSCYHPLKGLVPAHSVLVTLGISFFITMYSETIFCCDYGWFYRVLHITVGGVCGLTALVVMWFGERNLIEFAQKQYIKSKSTRKISKED